MGLLPNPRLALLLFLGIPLLGGAAVSPQSAGAFVMGAWAGALLVGPALMLVLWVLGVRSLRDVLRPLVHLPVVLALSALTLLLLRPELGTGAHALGAGAALWWVKRGGRLI